MKERTWSVILDLSPRIAARRVPEEASLNLIVCDVGLALLVQRAGEKTSFFSLSG